MRGKQEGKPRAGGRQHPNPGAAQPMPMHEIEPAPQMLRQHPDGAPVRQKRRPRLDRHGDPLQIQDWRIKRKIRGREQGKGKRFAI